jgi:hypothetical protein
MRPPTGPPREPVVPPKPPVPIAAIGVNIKAEIVPTLHIKPRRVVRVKDTHEVPHPGGKFVISKGTPATVESEDKDTVDLEIMVPLSLKLRKDQIEDLQQIINQSVTKPARKEPKS